MSTTRNIDIWQGSQHVEIWRAKDTNGVAVDFTGFDLRITVENSKGSLIAQRNLNVANAITGDSATVAIAQYGSLAGCIEIKLTAQETKLINQDSKYQLELVAGNIVNEPIFDGIFNAKSELKNV